MAHLNNLSDAANELQLLFSLLEEKRVEVEQKAATLSATYSNIQQFTKDQVYAAATSVSGDCT
jgi:hypothetical protein